MPSRSSSRGRRAATAALVLALAGALVPLGAGAGAARTAPSTGGPSAQQLETVAEQYNYARLRVERASALIETTNRRIQLAETRVATVRDRIRGRAAALYRRSSAGSPLPISDARTYTDNARHRRYLEAAELPDQQLANTLDDEIARLRVEEETQRQARAMLQRDADDAARLKRKLGAMAREAAAHNSLGTGDGAGPVATTAPAATPAVTGARSTPPVTSGTATPPTTRPAVAPPPSSPPPSSPPPNPPPPSSHGAIAVAYARAQLGKPYVFATAGPNTFDCSGLTMAAWAAAGVRMPHYSGSQATMFPRVGWDQLQPGDIVAFYGDLHHVGLYIGGGMMIHAPQTGDVVKIAPAWRTTFQWGVRPG